MKKVFETTDVLEVAEQILLKGHVQLTAEQKRQMMEDKRKQVIAKIAREGINPKTQEKISIAESKMPTFKFGKAYKDSFN